MGCCGSREAEKEAGKGTATKEKPAAGAPAAEEDPVEKAIKESFGKYDKDGNGEISSSDIAAVLKDAGMSLSKPQEIVLKKNPVVTASPVLKLEEVLKVRLSTTTTLAFLSSFSSPVSPFPSH